MTDEQQAKPKQPPADEISPDALMNDFRGMPIVKIVIFTVIVHVVFIGVFSVGYLAQQVTGGDTAKLSDDERMDLAVREGTSTLREIADRYDVNVQQLTSRFGDGTRRAGVDAGRSPVPADAPLPTGPAAPAEPGSEIERQLQQQQPGPLLPDLSVDKEDDLFAPQAP